MARISRKLFKDHVKWTESLDLIIKVKDILKDEIEKKDIYSKMKGKDEYEF